MLLACIGMSYLGIKMQRARRQKEAVEEIKQLGLTVSYDYHVLSGVRAPSSPKWLRNLLGDDFFTNVVSVHVGSTQVTDAGLEQLKGLTQLLGLFLENTKVTDAGLANLRALTQLQQSSLVST